MIFEFYEQKYLEKVYLKFYLVQSTKQERPKTVKRYFVSAVGTLSSKN